MTVTDCTIEQAIERLRNNEIDEINLTKASLTSDNLKKIATVVASHRCGLGVLRLRGDKKHSLSTKDMETMAFIVRHCKDLEQVIIGDANVDAEGIAILAPALQSHKRLRFFGCIRNHIGDEGMRAVATAIKHSRSIRELALVDDSISSGGFLPLAEALKGKDHFTSLHIGADHFKEREAEAIYRAVQTNKNLVDGDAPHTPLIELAHRNHVIAESMLERLIERAAPIPESEYRRIISRKPAIIAVAAEKYGKQEEQTNFLIDMAQLPNPKKNDGTWTERIGPRGSLPGGVMWFPE